MTLKPTNDTHSNLPRGNHDFPMCFGQLPDGSIAPDFTATDINGTTHNLQSYLDEVRKLHFPRRGVDRVEFYEDGPLKDYPGVWPEE